MAFLSIKNNPFDAYGDTWKGAGKRAESAACYAAEAASEVLLEEIKERAPSYDAFGGETVAETRVLQDAEGQWRVGLPEDSPHHASALEAEYGSETRSPQALMRVSEKRAQAEAEETFQEVLLSGIFGEGT